MDSIIVVGFVAWYYGVSPNGTLILGVTMWVLTVRCMFLAPIGLSDWYIYFGGDLSA